MPKKSRKKFNFDVYDANDNEDDSRKLLARRGGGGGAVGRTLDHIDVVDMDVQIDKEDDEEITEDDAFDDEDEEKYGLFFTNKDEENQDSSEDEEDGEYMNLSDLLDKKEEKVEKKKDSVSYLIPVPESESEEELDEDFSDEEEETKDLSNILKVGDKKRKRIAERTEAVEESEFKVLTGGNGNKKIALSDLFNEVSEENQFQDLKKQMGTLEDTHSKPLDVPLAPRMQDRINRQAAKEETNKSVAKWIPLVKANREADVLQLPVAESNPHTVTSKAIAATFQPFNEMEMEINQVLEESGLTDKKIRELEELELNKLSKEELEERRIDLARMRSLMFYKEQKQKKIAKIKSKTYRKIAKKANEKNELSIEELQKIDPERAKEERDRLEFERAKERMTMKHKNTGKWAKKMLGRAQDTETQKALMEQLQKGDQLRKRISGFDSDDSGVSDHSDEVDGLTRLEELEKQLQEEEAAPKKGLFAMKFMQRGLEKQKQETREMVENAKRELQGMDSNDDEPEALAESQNGRHVFGIQPSKNQFMEENVVTKPARKNGFSAQSSGPLQVKSEPLFKVDSFDDPESKLPEPVFERPKAKPYSKETKKTAEEVQNPEENPWLRDDSTIVKKSIQVAHKHHERSSKDAKAIAKIASERKNQLKEESADEEQAILPTTLVESDSEPENSEPALIHTSEAKKLNSKQIMQMAFANDTLAEVFLFYGRISKKRRRKLRN
jgi:U3 small nucleolar RNA-associated protein 14